MIHDVKFSEWTLKALRDLPVCAEEYDDKELEDEDWWNNLYRCSSSSLLNGDASVMVLDSQLQFACLGHFSHEICHCFSDFVSSHAASSRCIWCAFVCYNDHTLFSLYLMLSLRSLDYQHWPQHWQQLQLQQVLSSPEWLKKEPPIMTDLWLSSFRTSTNTSWIEGKGSLPRTHLRTSSNSLFNPARELNTRSFSIILKQALSAAHAHSNP